MDLGIPGLGPAIEIGVGASAIVYRTRQVDLDREVAVKVLSVTDEAFVRRFGREARTLGKLSQNPGIVTVYDSGVTNTGQPFLILELCGTSLHDQMKAQGTFAPVEACRIMAEVADAVNDAHRNGVIHRDIKPGNVLLSRKGRYMVTDFGIATVTGSTQPQTQSVGFTAGYVAPETLTGDEVSTPSDVYALGATLFHMIDGKAPFTTGEKSANLLALAQRVVSDPVPDLRPKGVPEAICRIIEGAMAKDSDSRPTTGQLRDQLLAVVKDPSTGEDAADDGQASAGAPVTSESETTSMVDGPATPPVLNAGGVTAGTAGGATATASTAGGFDGARTGTGPPSERGQELSSGGGILSDPPPPGATSSPPPPSPEGPKDDVGSRVGTPGYTPQPLARSGRDELPVSPLVVGIGMAVFSVLAIGGLLLAFPGNGGDDEDAIEAVGGPTAEVEKQEQEQEQEQEDGGGSDQFGPDRDAANRDRLRGSITINTSEPAVASTVVVPDVVGATDASARQSLAGQGFDVNVVMQESAAVDVGLVISQDPGPGDEAQKDTVVTIFVSGREVTEGVEVPNLVGLTRAAADTALTDLGLTAVISEEFDDAIELGEVVSSTPEAGVGVAEDSSVTVVVSTGPDCTTFVDQPAMTATAALEAAGYTVSSETEASAVASGGVIRCSQQPAAATATLTVSDGRDACSQVADLDGAAARATLEGLGLTVTVTSNFDATVAADDVVGCTASADTASLVVSRGPFPTDCDSVEGETELAAREALSSQGFPTVNIVQEESDTVDAGRVISCQITGSSVVLEVSTGGGATPIEVPVVTGQPTAAAAFTELTGAGFARGDEIEVASPEPAGTVLGTAPAVGTSHPPGTKVDVRVSSGGVAVPDLIGGAEATAVSRLTTAGLVPNVVESPLPAGNTADVGLVVSTSPTAGTLVAPGATVTVTVGRAATTSTAP